MDHRRFDLWAILVGLMVVVAPLATANEPATTTRVFTLRYASVADASTAVQPLLSEHGSLTVQPRQARLTVQDSPEVVRKVVRLIEEMDKAPVVYRIRVDLLEGTRSAPYSSPAVVEVSERVRRAYGYTSYRRLGSTSFEGEVGVAVGAALGPRYRVGFLAESLAGAGATPFGIPNPGSRVHLEWLRLERLPADGEEGEAKQILTTSAYLSDQQEVVIGVSGSEKAPTGLILMLRAEHIGAP